MTEYLQICDRLYNQNRIPMMVVNRKYQVFGIRSQVPKGFCGPKVLELVLIPMDFRLQKA